MGRPEELKGALLLLCSAERLDRTRCEAIEQRDGSTLRSQMNLMLFRAGAFHEDVDGARNALQERLVHGEGQAWSSGLLILSG